MAGAFDAYRELWVRLFGPDHPTAPTTQTPLVINADGSINVNTGGGITPPLSPQGYPDVATGQVTVTDTATQIVAANADRGGVTIVNEGTTDIWLGEAGVTIATGILLAGFKGASVMIPTSVAIFGIADTGESQVVSFMETAN